MAKRELLGHAKCPECGFDLAEVKAQKNGMLYRWCPDCEAQFFPRKAAASDRLRAQMSPVTVTEPEPVKKDEPAPVTLPAPEPKNKKPSPGFSLGAL